MRFWILAAVVVVPACDCGPVEVPLDAGVDAGSTFDAGERDAGVSDAGVPDAGLPDAGPPDAGPQDAGVDAGIDAGVGFDGGVPIDGGLGWYRVIGDMGWDDVAGLVLTPQGQVLLAGQLDYQVDVGCGALPGQGRDVFLASYDARDGGCRWSTRYGGPREDGADAIAYSAARDILYVGGEFRYQTGMPVTFGGAQLHGWADNRETPFLAAFRPGPTGPQHLWSMAFRGEGTVRKAVASPDGVVAGGTFYTFLQVNDAGVTRCCTSADGTWLAAVRDDGSAAWGAGMRITSNGIDSVYPGALWLQGDEVRIGFGSNVPMELGPTVVDAGAYVARFALDGGAVRGISVFGAPRDGGAVSAQYVIEEPNGELTLAGSTWEGADLGNGPLVGYAEHVYVARADRNGVITRASTFHIEYGGVAGFVKDPAGRYVLLGAFRGTRQFGQFTLTSGGPMSGTEDMMILVFSSDLSTVLHAERFYTQGEDFMGGHLVATPWGSWIVAQHFVESITVRGQTITGPPGWNVLLMELR